VTHQESGKSLFVDSTFAGNVASNNGGGIYSYPDVGNWNAIYAFTMQLINCDVTRNMASKGGGGLFLMGAKGMIPPHRQPML